MTPDLELVALDLFFKPDGGGIRGYWSLLVLQSLMRKIEEIEDGHGTVSSFDPCQKPRVTSQLSDGMATHFLPFH